MKAVVYRHYGSPDVLQYEEVEQPPPGDGEVLIRVRSASVNPIDRAFRGRPYLIRMMIGLRRPKNPRLGSDVAGQVEAVGAKVTRFKPGDAVFGACRGAFAEAVCASESTLVMKPDNVTYEQAAAVPVAGLTALQALRDKGRIQAGQKVLINGAAGGVGTFAVQIARSFGAEVTGVCSTRNLELVRSIGAGRAIDYSREDFSTGTERYDLILDCVGNRSLPDFRRVLSPHGICVLVGSPPNVWVMLPRALQGLALSRLGSQRFVLLMARVKKEDLAILGELMAAGKITPVIDRRYRLREVPEAIRYLEERHARGKIVITFENDV